MTISRSRVVGRRLRPGRCRPVPLSLFLDADPEMAERDRVHLADGFIRPDTTRPWLCKNGDVTVRVVYRKSDCGPVFDRHQVAYKIRYSGVFRP